MLVVKVDGSIQLTRGDSAEFEVAVVNEVDKSSYVVKDSDTMILTMKKSVKIESEVVLQKRITGSNVFSLTPADTNHLPFCKYFYDVELRTTDGGVFTVIPPTLFEITAEVTCADGS